MAAAVTKNIITRRGSSYPAASWRGILFLLILLGFLWSYSALANGGDQRVVESKYLINLSRAPFTPRGGVTTALLPSFFDIEKNKLVAEDLLVKVRIYRFGGSGEEKRVLLFEKRDIPVQGGVLEGLSYIFAKPGLHEIFFDFAFASNPQKIYEAPDFLLDVQREPNGYNTNQILIAVFGSFVMGLIAGWFVKRIASGRVG